MSLRTFPLASIRIPEHRQRKKFDEASISELAASILTHGLLHPPVVRIEVSDRAATPVLVAGYRRWKAIQSISNRGLVFSFGTSRYDASSGIPVLLLSEAPLEELQAREIELDENIRRVDLSWQERVEAIAELEALRKAQAQANGLASPGQRGIAAEAGITQSYLSKASIIAAHLSDPNIARQATIPDAYKAVLRKTENEFLARLRPSAAAAKHELILGDCLSALSEGRFINKFDCIITDPPYGVDAASWKGTSGRLAHVYEDSPTEFFNTMNQFASLSYKITKAQAHLFLFYDFRHHEFLVDILSSASWFVWRRPIIWHKPGSGIATYPDHTPRNSYETILFCIKGEKRLLDQFPDVLSYPSPTEKQHAAEKPAELYSFLLRKTCIPGSFVCDPFAGSGTIFPASASAGCIATGIERDEAIHRTAQGKLHSITDAKKGEFVL